MASWGRVMVGTRLEKQVTARFVENWSHLLMTGLRPGDGATVVRGMVAHKAANELVRHLLASDADSILFLDSDAQFTPDIVRQMCAYEPGQQYDVLQAWYPRRGWPPRAIWMRRNALGDMMEYFTTDPDMHEPVDLCGLHACLVRRQVYEAMLGDADPAQHEWYYYPRHKNDSEDGAFSADALAAGFKLGATTHVKTGHISEIVTDWTSYMQYLHYSGRLPLIERYRVLAEQVADFTGESAEVVVAKAARASQNVREVWQQQQPCLPAEVRAFYGDHENGYLYDLLEWNCSPMYQQLLNAIAQWQRSDCLVIGAGLGLEAEVLASLGNRVDVFDLPGILRTFAEKRLAQLGHDVHFWQQHTLPEVPGSARYDLVVALDVLEHVHPDELQRTLDAIDRLLRPGGALYAHNNWGQQDIYPMHYDHSAPFSEWARQAGLAQVAENHWRKS